MKLRELIGNVKSETEAEKGFKFNEEFDVIVCGGGTAGAVAAITAAQEGAKTLCIETLSYLGGMGTGIVMGYYDGEGMKGLCADMDREAREESKRSCCNIKKWCAGIHCEAKKLVYEREYSKYGGTVYYHSMVIGVFTEDDTVCGVRALVGGEVRDIGCRALIDATSEANICRIANLPTKSGRDADSQCQAYSVVSFVINQEGELEHVYRDNGFVDDGDMCAVSNAITSSYADSDTIGAYSKNEVSNKLILCGSVFGKREGLHSVGIDSMTGRNLLEFKEVKMPLFKMSSPYDTHLHDGAFESDLVNDFLAKGLKDTVLTMSFPFGAMIPKGIDGMVTAGLSMDVEHDAVPPVRLKMNVMRSGEAAGAVCAISCRTGKRLADCYEDIKENLVKRNLYYDEIKIPREIHNEFENKKEIQLYLTGKQNKCGEHTDSIGACLSETENYQVFSYAFAAMMRSAAKGDGKAVEKLRDLLEDEGFSRKLILNGKKKQTVIERNNSLRAYCAKIFDEKNISHNIYHFLEKRD